VHWKASHMHLVLVGADAGEDDEVLLAALEGVHRRHLDPLVQRLLTAREHVEAIQKLLKGQRCDGCHYKDHFRHSLQRSPVPAEKLANKQLHVALGILISLATGLMDSQ